MAVLIAPNLQWLLHLRMRLSVLPHQHIFFFVNVQLWITNKKTYCFLDRNYWGKCLSDLVRMTYVGLYYYTYSQFPQGSLLLSHIPILLRDVHSWRPNGRDTSTWTLPRPRSVSRRNDGSQPRSLTRLSPQYDGAQPRTSWIGALPSSTGTLRISSGQYASDAQGTDLSSLFM